VRTPAAVAHPGQINRRDAKVAGEVRRNVTPPVAMRAAAMNEHMQADARQRHDWRAFPLRWRLAASTVGPGAPNWFSISSAARANGDHFVLASASVVRQELDQEKGIHYLKTLPGLVRGSGILNR